jgi:hypothetical protein
LATCQRPTTSGGIDASLTGSDIYRYNIDQRFGPGDARQGTIVDPAYFGGFNNLTDYTNENTTGDPDQSRLGSRFQ